MSLFAIVLYGQNGSEQKGRLITANHPTNN